MESKEETFQDVESRIRKVHQACVPRGMTRTSVLRRHRRSSDEECEDESEDESHDYHGHWEESWRPSHQLERCSSERLVQENRESGGVDKIAKNAAIVYGFC